MLFTVDDEEERIANLQIYYILTVNVPYNLVHIVN